jgi:hypothetical protein
MSAIMVRKVGKRLSRRATLEGGLLVKVEPLTTIVPARPEPASPEVSVSPLDEILRAVNRIRTEHGADPLYELPKGTPALEDGACVLEKAFADLGVLYVDYEHGVGRGLRIRHGLGPFIRSFDAGLYPQLVKH